MELIAIVTRTGLAEKVGCRIIYLRPFCGITTAPDFDPYIISLRPDKWLSMDCSAVNEIKRPSPPCYARSAFPLYRLPPAANRADIKYHASRQVQNYPVSPTLLRSHRVGNTYLGAIPNPSSGKYLSRRHTVVTAITRPMYPTVRRPAPFFLTA